ncbi:MAG TPA: hypothetical protein PK165_01350 [bacterium]|nr:hypothetical protein [bacterium]HOL49668.1 hypothetical protein [bacterium]HPO51459.1 hypothetical protein [bacterium]
MITWVILILIMGLMLLFFPEKIVENDWVKQIGLAITLICIGIGVRMTALRRKGKREKLETKIKELEKEIETLRSQISQAQAAEEKKEENQ